MGEGKSKAPPVLIAGPPPGGYDHQLCVVGRAYAERLSEPSEPDQILVVGYAKCPYVAPWNTQLSWRLCPGAENCVWRALLGQRKAASADRRETGVRELDDAE